jgi:hypothetical protein
MDAKELSFDGHGINGPDEYRTRIATFNWSNPLAKNYPELFEAAPELLEACKAAERALQCTVIGELLSDHFPLKLEMLRKAIAKAEGRV